jgi:hypothetical protein
MLPLLLRVKLELPLLPEGACQKSPQPAKSGVAANRIRAQFPIFMTAPHALRSFVACFGWWLRLS